MIKPDTPIWAHAYHRKVSTVKQEDKIFYQKLIDQVNVFLEDCSSEDFIKVVNKALGTSYTEEEIAWRGEL